VEVAVEKMIIWIYSKRDQEEKYKKGVINFVLVILTVFLFYKLQNTQLLLINGLLCLLFSFKFLFYIPVVSVRIVDNDRENKLFFIDKEAGVNTEIKLSEISFVRVLSDKIIVKEVYSAETEIPLDFHSDNEVRRLKDFFERIGKFELK